MIKYDIFLSSWFDRGRNKHHLRCCFTIWGFQIKIHFKLNLMGFPYKKYFKALILLNVNTLSNISTKWQMVQKASWVERCVNGICLRGRSEFSWLPKVLLPHSRWTNTKRPSKKRTAYCGIKQKHVHKYVEHVNVREQLGQLEQLTLSLG